MKIIALSALSLAAMSIPTVVANAQDAHHQHHEIHMNALGSMPAEPGQSAFAAIAEIVAMLMSDTETDWNKVDIDALQKHLVDMNELTLNAKVKAIEDDGAVIFEVTGTGRAFDAIRTMVPAHAEVLKTETGWDTSVEMGDSAVKLRISASDPQELAMIRGLGFFGIMATGAHHQQHHLAIARGEMTH